MRSRPTATAHDIGDLINAMPTMFGFPPQDSFVGFGLDGKRICFGMRLDLSDIGDVESAADYIVRHLQNQVVSSGIKGAIVVALGEPLDRGRDLVLAVESRLFAGRSERRRITVRPVAGGWATDDRYWVSMAGGDPDGYPYRRSLDHPLTLQGIAEGQEVVASRAELAAKLAPIKGPRRRRIQSAAADIKKHHGATSDDALVETVRSTVQDLYAMRHVSDRSVVEVAYALSRRGVRNSAWDLITPDNARDMVRVWVHVARCAPTAWAPTALGLVAWSAWLRGDGAFAVTAAQRALEIDKDCPMALFMLGLATSGVSPDLWAHRRDGVTD